MLSWSAWLIRKISASLYIESETAERMVGHSIQSLFRIKDADPTVLYETFSPVEQVLLKDPAGTYPRCVPETKETYRRAVRRMARRTKNLRINWFQSYMVWQTPQNPKKGVISVGIFCGEKGMADWHTLHRCLLCLPFPSGAFSYFVVRTVFGFFSHWDCC